MATACFWGFPSLLRSRILSLIFCFCERLTRLVLATRAPVPGGTDVMRDTAPEPSPRLQGGLFPVEPVGPAMGPSSKLLGGRTGPAHFFLGERRGGWLDP